MKKFFFLSASEIIWMSVWIIFNLTEWFGDSQKDFTRNDNWCYFRHDEMIGTYDWREFVTYILGAYLAIVLFKLVDYGIVFLKKKREQKKWKNYYSDIDSEKVIREYRQELEAAKAKEK